MPLLGFQKHFAEKVASGEKRQTIRAFRKDGRDPKVGDRLYLYTGLRTKEARKLGEAVCTSVRGILIQRRQFQVVSDDPECPSPANLAKADGFESFDAMLDWFEKVHGLPFEGVLIRWGDLDSEQDGEGR